MTEANQRHLTHSLGGCGQKIVILSALCWLTGCSVFQPTVPSNTVAHGMAPSSTGPSPEWYATYYNPARGAGEALRQNHQAMWDNKARGYTYYVGGEIFASYHPWQHRLTIRTDNDNGRNLRCHWSKQGQLKANGPRPKGLSSQEACIQLLNTLQGYLSEKNAEKPS